MSTALLLVLVSGSFAPTHAYASSLSTEDTNPVAKVIEMLTNLEQKIIKEGEAAQKVYDEYTEWCEERSKNLGFEIKTAKAEIEDLQATIGKAVSDIGAQDASIEELSGSITTDETDLKSATEIRDKEAADFAAEEAELMDSVDILGRAISIIEREMQGGASFVQLKNAKNVVDALRVLLSASAISSSDASKLTALLQNKDNSDDEDYGLGAPDPAVYKSHSGGIVDVLTDLLDKAEAELAEARKKEANSKNNFEVLEVELKDAIKFANSQMEKAQKAKAAAAETKAVAEGDLTATEKSLAEDTEQHANLHHDCMTKAEDFEASTKSRGEELKALAQAKKIISETTSGAAGQAYALDQTSFVQIVSISSLNTRADLANFEAIRYIRNLARKFGSAALTQLAHRMAAAARLGSAGGDDPFVKVKGLISEMIERLLKEGEEEASHKAYCDKEMAETEHKKDDLSAEIEKLSTKIDSDTAASAKLKSEVATLQKELADLAKAQAEMDKLRQEEKAEYESNKAEMEEGLEGIKMALKVLREYYAQDDAAHGAAEGAGGGIIGMLEVIESDFSKGLSEMIAAEETAQAEYEKETRENEIAKTLKEQDVKYKTKEFKSLDKAVSEANQDREGVQAELDSVLEYYENIKKQCIVKAEPYEERKKRREAEIAGLKEALSILEGEAVLLQRKQGLRLKRHVA